MNKVSKEPKIFDEKDLVSTGQQATVSISNVPKGTYLLIFGQSYTDYRYSDWNRTFICWDLTSYSGFNIKTTLGNGLRIISVASTKDVSVTVKNSYNYNNGLTTFIKLIAIF